MVKVTAEAKLNQPSITDPILINLNEEYDYDLHVVTLKDPV